MLTQIMQVARDNPRGKELFKEMPPSRNLPDACGAKADGATCSREKGHPGLHALHSQWGFSADEDGRVIAYWVRGS